RFADPALASNAGVVRPWWNGTSFGGGYGTIREVFLALVEQHGRPGSTGGGLGQALAAQVPATDIRGVARGAPPYDIGAYERDGEAALFANGFE
ncbi:MAG TPA: choice-of-anchor Q domain-containing protein, partial [Xanthomonadales bacterium]|nr:choice-of-anchor Q domain-containing protein [Xanthomonadales bacterium]